MDNLTELYCHIDYYYQQIKPELEKQLITNGKKRLRPCEISVAEIMTILVLFHQLRHRQFKQFYYYHMLGMMKGILSRPIADLNNDIDDYINKHPELKQDQVLLESIKGVGSAVSRLRLSLMHNKSFNSASQMAAFLGLVLKHHESGLFKGKSRLAKNGSSNIRAKLYMPALVVIKHNPDIKVQYEHLLANGKCKMQAVCAAMRKLVHICYGVVKHQMPYVLSVNISSVN